MGDIDKAARLERACVHLGDVVVDPAMWAEMIEKICAAAGATGGMLLQSDARTADVPRTISMADALSFYFKHHWHTRDLLARGYPRLQKGRRVVTTQDIVTPEEMRREAFYHEVIYRHGLCWSALVGFSAGSALWGLSIQRSRKQGSFTEEDKSLLGCISQQLTEAATLSAAVGRIALASVGNALNAVSQPAVALDRLGFVLDANRSVDALFDADIRVKDRRLAVRDAAAKRDLEKLTDRMVATSDLATLPCEPIVVRRREKCPVIVRVLPVHGAARTPFLGARVILTLTPIEPRPRPKGALLTRAFGLTSAEARLASIIAEGANPEQAAEELGVSRVTVRNQLRVIFSKTNAHRQSELVALLSRL